MLTRRVRGEELRVVRLAQARQAWQYARSRDRANDPDRDDQPAEANIEAGERLERGDSLLSAADYGYHIIAVVQICTSVG